MHNYIHDYADALHFAFFCQHIKQQHVIIDVDYVDLTDDRIIDPARLISQFSVVPSYIEERWRETRKQKSPVTPPYAKPRIFRPVKSLSPQGCKRNI